MMPSYLEWSMLTAATFDLETTSLNADFGIVLCGVVQPHDSKAKPIVFRGDKLNRHWNTKRSDDSATVKAIVECLSQFDILIAYNGAKFDIPFLRSRLAKSSLPPFPNKKLIDPVMQARSKLKLSYNSLDKLANHLGCNSKTQVAGDYWLAAALDGSPKAMNYVVEHCIEDVITLDKVFDKIKEYVGNINNWGSGF